MDFLNISDVFAPFYEEPEHDKSQLSFEDICARETEAQGNPPIVFFDHLPDSEKAIVKKHFEAQFRNIFRQPEHVPLPAPHIYAAPPGPSVVERAFCVSALKALADDTQGQRKKSTAMALMHTFLGRVILRNFEGNFYYFENGIYHFLPLKELKSYISMHFLM